MRIVYMGSPEIAVPTLEFLAGAQDVVACFTRADKPKGRGHKMLPTPVKEMALSHDIPIFQPATMRREPDAGQTLDALQKLRPDLIVVLAYGLILPKAVLDLPRFGCINLHASLLPKYRGAAPIQWCIRNGERETGITAMQMAEGLDTGDMLLTKKIEIAPEETTAELSARLGVLAAQTLAETLERLEAGTLAPIPQDDACASYAPRITKEMSRLDFSQSAVSLHNLIRAITGYTTLDGKRFKIYASRVVLNAKGAPGTVVNGEDFVVACGDGNGLQFLEVQPEGKRRMGALEFLRGRLVPAGTMLGEL